MSIQRIETTNGRTKGWQARQYTKAPKYLSAFFADKLHGGKRKAKALALAADEELRSEAEVLRRRW